MPRAIVTSTYRYKRPPRKKKPVPLVVPAIVTVTDRKRVERRAVAEEAQRLIA